MLVFARSLSLSLPLSLSLSLHPSPPLSSQSRASSFSVSLLLSSHTALFAPLRKRRIDWIIPPACSRGFLLDHGCNQEGMRERVGVGGGEPIDAGIIVPGC